MENSTTLNSFKDQIQKDNMITEKEKFSMQTKETSPTINMKEYCETSLCIIGITS